MNAFAEARTVEARALVRLESYLTAHGDHLRILSRGPIARFLQETVGDMLINTRAGETLSIELKAEKRHTGNLFLETWSNRNLDNRANHALVGSNPGWLCKSRADLLLYYFLDTDQLYVAEMFALKRWAFADGNLTAQYPYDTSGRTPGCVDHYPEVRQSKYQQANDTWGRLVPVRVLKETLKPPLVVVTVQQLEFFRGGEDPIGINVTCVSR